MEGFCGKNCDPCAWRAELQCPGCQSGPGRAMSGDCEIAACCRSKGHMQCGTCVLSGCGLRAGKDQMPARWRQRMAVEGERRRWMDSNAPILGKWLWLLFWLFIPSEIASLMINDNVLAAVPALRTPGEILSILCGVAYGLILLKLTEQAKGYRLAGICSLVSAAFSLVMLATGLGEGTALWWLLSLPVVVVELFGVYQEFNAHADVLAGMDDALSGKWRKLWKWHIGLLLGMTASLVLTAMMGMLGLLIMLVAVIGIIVVAILKLVYLYRTAKLFRTHLPQALSEVVE